VLRLGEVSFKIGSGATPRGGSDVYLSSGVALIRSQNIYNDGFYRDGLVYISDAHASELAGVEVQAGDVLLNITGDSVARCCRAPVDVLPARVNQHVAIIRPNPDVLDPRYLHYHLISPLKQGEMLSMAGGGGTRNALTKGMIERFEIPAPDIETQRAIAGVLGSLDDKIEQNRRMTQALERLARAIFKAWFVDFEPVKAKAAGATSFPSMRQGVFDALPTTFTDSEIGPLPEGWAVRRATHVAHVAIGKTPPRKEPQWFTGDPSQVPWVSIRDMGTCGPFISRTAEYLTYEAVERFNIRRIPDASVLLSFKLTLGRVTIADGEITSNEAIAHFVPELPDIVGTEYLYCYLIGFDHNRLGSTSSIATATNSQAIKAMPVLVPDSSTAEAFTKTARPLFDLMRALSRESRRLAAMREYLLPVLFSGRVRVEVANG